MTLGRAVVGNCACRFSTTALGFGSPKGTRSTMRLRLYSLAPICIWLSLPFTSAMWPFPPKRFKGNALLGAGVLGLNTDGRVVALGDFNGDQLCVPLHTPEAPRVFKLDL